MEYDETNTGVLFFGDKKSEKAPDWSGKFNHNGVEIKLAGWSRTSKSGKEFISLRVDTYEPKKDGEKTGYEKAQETWKKIAHKDEVADIPDEPFDMSQIPF